MLYLAFVAAEALDLSSMRWSEETNPFVVFLGPSAFVAKLGLVLLVLSIAGALERARAREPRLRPIARALLLVGSAIGLFGWWTNVA